MRTGEVVRVVKLPSDSNAPLLAGLYLPLLGSCLDGAGEDPGMPFGADPWPLWAFFPALLGSAKGVKVDPPVSRPPDPKGGVPTGSLLAGRVLLGEGGLWQVENSSLHPWRIIQR